MRSRVLVFQKRREQAAGFSLVELVVAMAVALVLMAIGMPYFLRAFHAYQLTNSAYQLADILRLTRYDAMRLNGNGSCVINPDPLDSTMTDVFADENGDGIRGPNEEMIQLGNGGNLVGGGVPGAGGMLTSANVTSATLTEGPGNATIQFDWRGAGNPATNVAGFYLASPTAPDAGYRAVLLMPSGSIQVWTSDINGNW